MACNIAKAEGYSGTSHRVIPGDFTANGKPLITSYETDRDNGITLVKFYDSNLNVSKTLSINLPSYLYNSYTEYATVVPIGVIAGSKRLRDYSNTDGWINPEWLNNKIDVSSITTSDEFVTAITNAYEENEFYDESVWIGFIDEEGRISAKKAIYAYYDYYDYFDFSHFGTTYPERYYTISDGAIWLCEIDYDYDYPSDNSTWGKRADNSFISHESLGSFMYINYDESGRTYGDSGYGIHLSQTLFNDDNKWEYLMPVLEEYEEYSIPYYSWKEDSLELERRYTHTARIIYYNVVSEDGTVVTSIKPVHSDATKFEIYQMWKLDGHLYLNTCEWGQDSNGESWRYDTLYIFDNATSSVKEVSTVKARPQMARVQGNAICVNLDEADTDSDLMLSNMSGQVLGQLHVAAGQTQTQMNAAQLPKGVYNLTLRRHGQVLNNQKLMVK